MIPSLPVAISTIVRERPKELQKWAVRWFSLIYSGVIPWAKNSIRNLLTRREIAAMYDAKPMCLVESLDMHRRWVAEFGSKDEAFWELKAKDGKCWSVCDCSNCWGNKNLRYFED